MVNNNSQGTHTVHCVCVQSNSWLIGAIGSWSLLLHSVCTVHVKDMHHTYKHLYMSLNSTAPFAVYLFIYCKSCLSLTVTLSLFTSVSFHDDLLQYAWPTLPCRYNLCQAFCQGAEIIHHVIDWSSNRCCDGRVKFRDVNYSGDGEIWPGKWGLWLMIVQISFVTFYLGLGSGLHQSSVSSNDLIIQI